MRKGDIKEAENEDNYGYDSRTSGLGLETIVRNRLAFLPGMRSQMSARD